MALSPVQHLTVKYLASGWSVARTAAELKLGAHIINKWKYENEEFQQALQKGVAHHAELVEAMLLEGEAKAAETLIAALSATGKNGPQWGVRFQAAVSLLDRAGSRGRPVERQLGIQGHVSTKPLPEIEGALRKALRDPGVRSWLKATGGTEVLAEIEGQADEVEVKQLSSGETPEQDVA